LGIKRAERAEREKARAAMGAVTGVSGVGSSPAPSVRPAGSSGWVAANTPRASSVWEEHDAKRRRMDEAGGFHTYKSGADDTPTRKPIATLSVEQMGGGLSGSTATAETQDPTLPPPSQPAKVYEEAGARVEIHKPTQIPANGTPERPSPASSGTPSGDAHQEGASAAPSTTQPISMDDSSGSSDDEDIPSTLPPQQKRKSLTPHRGGAAVMS
jgi:hypothetical protein